MAKMKLLKQVVEDMRQLASSLEEWCTAIEGNTKPIEEKAESPETTVELETIRAILADKSRLGFTKDIKDILLEFGASKLSDVNARDYAAILKKVEVLGNE